MDDKIKRNTVPQKVPYEFNELVMDLKEGFEKATGERYTKTQVLKKMGNKLRGKLITRGNDFDWKIF